MKIEINTDNLSDLDIAMLTFLASQGDTPEAEGTPAPAPAPKKAPAAKKAPAPVVDPEPEEDLLGGDEPAPTMSDAVAAATKLVSAGKTKEVKAALESVGVKRVSEMKDEDIPAFLAALPQA